MTRYFTEEHEWIDVDGNVGTVGISDYAQGQLGDITFVELPLIDRQATKGEAVSVVDSVKAASDIYTPVGGTILAINEALESEPELVNTDAEKSGWLFRIKIADAGELGSLMDKTAYDAYVAGL